MCYNSFINSVNVLICYLKLYIHNIKFTLSLTMLYFYYLFYKGMGKVSKYENTPIYYKDK